MLSATHAGCTAFSAFGVFDGHGGKSVATYASKSLLPLVAGYADRCKGSEPLPPDAEAVPMDVGEEQRCCMTAQDALVERLPRVSMQGGAGTVRMNSWGEEGRRCGACACTRGERKSAIKGAVCKSYFLRQVWIACRGVLPSSHASIHTLCSLR